LVLPVTVVPSRLLFYLSRSVSVVFPSFGTSNCPMAFCQLHRHPDRQPQQHPHAPYPSFTISVSYSLPPTPIRHFLTDLRLLLPLHPLLHYISIDSTHTRPGSDLSSLFPYSIYNLLYYAYLYFWFLFKRYHDFRSFPRLAVCWHLCSSYVASFVP